jgi:hypothetical protein
VEWGNIISSRPDLIAAAGEQIYLFAPAGQEYVLISTADTEARVLSMAVGLAAAPPQYIVTGLEDRVALFGIRERALARLFETEPETGALFVDQASPTSTATAGKKLSRLLKGTRLFTCTGWRKIQQAGSV